MAAWALASQLALRFPRSGPASFPEVTTSDRPVRRGLWPLLLGTLPGDSFSATVHYPPSAVLLRKLFSGAQVGTNLLQSGHLENPPVYYGGWGCWSAGRSPRFRRFFPAEDLVVFLSQPAKIRSCGPDTVSPVFVFVLFQSSYN